MRHVPLPLLAAAAPILAAACGHVPLSTMIRMRNLDPSTVDPEALRAAIRMPVELAPTPRGMKLVVRTWREGDATSRREEELVLTELTSDAERDPLSSRCAPGMRVHVFRVDPADLQRIRAMQAAAIAARRAGGRVRGSLSIDANACRRAELGSGPLLVTTFLRMDSREGFFTLVEDLDLREAVAGGQRVEDVVPRCDPRP